MVGHRMIYVVVFLSFSMICFSNMILRMLILPITSFAERPLSSGDSVIGCLHLHNSSLWFSALYYSANLWYISTHNSLYIYLALCKLISVTLKAATWYQYPRQKEDDIRRMTCSVESGGLPQHMHVLSLATHIFLFH